MLKLKNTLSRQLEEFKPLDDNLVRVYACGPTVYDYGHIGNFRSFVAEDVLRRYLLYLGYNVKFVMNITDIEDKIIRGLQESGKSLSEYTSFYTDEFVRDLELLNISKPDCMPRATDHIPEMIDLMNRLEERGHTYRGEGSLYFSIESFPAYGKLTGSKLKGNKSGARVDVDEYDKADARDFVLWKATKDEGEPSWPSPFGPGRPGWHLECSAMSMKYLGESFDLHCGGVDLIFPHHENEIAQSEGATGHPFVNSWFHVEFLIVEGEKMSKSKGNFYTLRQLVEKGYSPAGIRYLLLSVPYGTKLNFTLDGLRGAESSLERLRNFRRRLTGYNAKPGSEPGAQEIVNLAMQTFESSMNEDLNTSAALGGLFEMIRDINTQLDSGKLGENDRQAVLTLLERIDSVFGVIGSVTEESADPEIEAKIDARNAARRNRDFGLADRIRQELARSRSHFGGHASGHSLEEEELDS